MKSTAYEPDELSRGTVSDFIQERRYLKAVTPKTLAWYGDSFRAFAGAIDSEAAIKQRIVELRTRGVSPISVNSWLRCINAYLNWKHAGFKIPRLKEEQKVLATLTPEQMRMLIAFKAKGINQTRTHMAALLILDGGYSISEVLGLLHEHCDFENLVIKVRGKGGKHRLVPLSTDMRRVLFRYAAKYSARGRPLFGTRSGTLVTVRDFQRDFKLIGEKLRITRSPLQPAHPPSHVCCVVPEEWRESVLFLQNPRVFLRHDHTAVFAEPQLTDLQAVHDRLSPLAPVQLRGAVK